VPNWLRNMTLVLVAILLVLGIGVFLFFNRGMEEVLALEIGSIDFSAVPDGVYLGSFAQNRWVYEVQVQVTGGVLEGIEIVRCKHEPIVRSMNKQVIEQILSSQSLDIQGVTGATVTTKALQKAVENALANIRP
jgi:uncharacterized protein with FMN-binding domain